MTPEERQASTLADWLEAGPGAPPPEELDLDVIEATYSLRPSMAPAARVSLDDILAGVTAGPFAPHAAPLPDAAPEALPAPANVPDFGGAVAPAPPHRRQSLWGALGALAAAALVLVTVLPLQDEVSAPPDAAAPPMVDAPQAAEPEAQSVMPLGDIAESKADLEQRRQNSGPMPLTEVTASPPPPPVAQAAPGAAPRYEDTLVLDGSYGKKQESVAELERATDEADDAGGFAQNGPVGGVAAEGYASTGTAATRDVTATSESVVASKESGRRDRPAGRSAASNSVATPAEAEEARPQASADYDTMPAAASAPAKAAAKPTTSLASQRAAAMPADYRASWYTSLPDATLVAQLSAAEAAAKAAAAKGDYNAAFAAVGPFLNHADARVAQDFGGRSADYALKAGSANAALSTIRAAKSRSSANTPYLARLWAIEGAAYEALGDTESAQRAYAEAARLNQSR